MDIDEVTRRVAAVTDSTLAHLDVDELLRELLDRVCEILSVDSAGALLVDEPSQTLYASASKGLEDEVRHGFRVPVGRGFAGRVAAARQPVTLHEVTLANSLNPILVKRGIRTALGVPMVAEDQLVGVLYVGSLGDRRFVDEDRTVLQLVADRVALATRAQMLRADRLAAVALQRSLQPQRLPAVPGLDLASRYIPDSRAGVGGDWYDVFVLGSGWVGLAIGDVAGRGVPAAAVMGRLRTALRAYAMDWQDPADVLSKLDRYVQHFEAGTLATVLYGLLEPSLERFHFSVAGHPAPALGAQGVPPGIVNVAPDLPLGVDAEAPRSTVTIELPAGAAVCLYSNGLVESRGRGVDDALQRLTGVLSGESAEQICDRILAELTEAETTTDDIALLVALKARRG